MSHDRASDVERVPFPRPRDPARADLWSAFDTLRGRPLVLATSAGPVYHLVAWGEPYESGGGLWVDVVTEESWWRYVLLGEAPERRAYPASALGVLFV